jgi:beta-lactamase regulating signal transducer with metallopeptidase domain
MSELLASFGANLGSAASVAASALVSALWEGVALAGLVWLALRAFPRLSAAARSMVWLGVFALLIGLQMVALAGRATSDTPVAYGLHLDARWGYAILGLWAALSALRAVQLGIGVAHLRRLASRAVEVEADADLKAALDEAAAGRQVRLCMSNEIARPSVIGFLGPKILLPAALLQNLSAAELKQVLIHEMEHLRRADDWTNLLQKLALVAFPLNPALAWVERRLCAERELACDDRVLEAGNGRKAYALCLAHLAEHAMLLQRGMSLALGAWERRPELVRRVERILRGGERTLGRRIAIGVTGSVMAASLCIALGLSRSPQVVSFAPIQQAELAPADLPKLTEGVKPQLAKAIMPAEPAKALRCVKAMRKQKAAELKLADLRKPLEKAPGADKLLVMTEWNDLGVQQRMVLTALREARGPSATAVPAIYVVATPNGWLIVQI